MDKLQQSYLFIPNKFKVMNVLLALVMNPLWAKICNEVPLIPLRPNLILFENTDSFCEINAEIPIY